MRFFKTISLVLIVGFAFGMFSAMASAECGNYSKTEGGLLKPQAWDGATDFGFGSFVLASAHDYDDEDPIVGFWRTKFIVGGNVTDAGFSQWHSDGTEILNSSRPPATSSFCLGVWKRVGRRTYKLNHFAISWSPTGTFVGNTNIREEIALSRDGKNYAGTLTIDQYDPAGNLLVHIEGEVQATRITVQTQLGDIL